MAGRTPASPAIILKDAKEFNRAGSVLIRVLRTTLSDNSDNLQDVGYAMVIYDIARGSDESDRPRRPALPGLTGISRGC